MNHPLRLFAAALALAFLAPAATGQPVRAWAGVGLGTTTAGEGFQPTSGRAALHVLRGEAALSARLTLNSVNAREDLFGTSSDELFDAALTVGYAPRTGGPVQLVVGAGPAVVWGREFVGRDPTSCGFWGCRPEREGVGPALGLAAEAGAYGRLGRAVGYSVVVHGNANGVQRLVGVTVGLTAGRLK